MEHLSAIYQILVPALVALNVWLLRQALAGAKAILNQNKEEHASFERAIHSHEERLTRVETRVEICLDRREN